MHQLLVPVLAVSTFASLGAAGGNVPRGVGPQFVKHYGSKDSFTCITNPSIKIDASKVNDNSCDCPDGSDEPGTAACAKLDSLSPPQPLPGSTTGSTNTTNALPGFWCENKGHIGGYIPFTYVNDGVCDYDLCCDGSEEYSGVGGVKCPNKCAEIGKEYRRIEDERRKAMEKAIAARVELIRQAKQVRRNIETTIANLKNDVAQAERKKIELQAKFDEIERVERRKVVKASSAASGKLGELLEQSRMRVEELRDTLQLVVDQRNELRTKGVKQAVKSWEDYAAKLANEGSQLISDAEVRDVLLEDGELNGVNWKDFEPSEEEADETDIIYNFQAYVPTFVLDLFYKQMDNLRQWLNEEDDLAKDYGPEEIFRALKDKCVSTEAGEYTYELCWFKKTMQKSKKGHGNTNMGDYARIDREFSDEEDRLDGKGLGTGERMVLRYENGQSCWNGPRRRTDVWLACAEKEELWRVSESEKCVYKMEVGTPAACDPQGPAEKGKQKDEL
ncbi:unnamed protein product [Parascedosporium putredinis]|uniref:Glucosidase 2 subunit beta n=1 Tax=Parascedosporium putredinis TaxID=1442378 RepID=A0A9P1M9J7_9PEZI|nr:unnamed protein product [Parascedosporium putredinis]CAI7992206.1 unnamed protein product [Parascedosporium putredinis]